MSVLDLRWRPVVLAAVIGAVGALAVPIAWSEVSRPIRVGHGGFTQNEIDAAYVKVALLCVVGFGVAIGMFVWAQGKAARITVDRAAKQAVLARGFPLAWSTKTYDLDDLAFVLDTKRANRGIDVYFVYVSAGGRRYMVERAGASLDHAMARVAQLTATTGIPS